MSEDQTEYVTRFYRREYLLVEEDSAERLTDTLNEMFIDGWELHGATQVIADSASSGGFWFYQAVIRYCLDEQSRRSAQAVLEEVALGVAAAARIEEDSDA